MSYFKSFSESSSYNGSIGNEADSEGEDCEKEYKELVKMMNCFKPYMSEPEKEVSSTSSSLQRNNHLISTKILGSGENQFFLNNFSQDCQMSGGFPSLDQSDDHLEQGYDEHFDPPAPDVYECPICLMVLRKPMQTECGHRFCRGCILKSVREGRPNCPIDNENLSEDQIYPDNFARREILRLLVRCPNFKTFNCQWHKSLKELPKHVKECEFSTVQCPNKCNIEILRNQLQKHLQEECIQRIVSCEYCNMKVVFRQLEEHKERCPSHPIPCPNGCNTKLVREQLEKHLEIDCPNVEAHCPFEEAGCKFTGSRDELKKHLEDPTNNHMYSMLEAMRELRNRVEKAEKMKFYGTDMEKMDIDQPLQPGISDTKELFSDNNGQSIEKTKLAAKIQDLEMRVSTSSTISELCRNELKQNIRETNTKFEALQQTIKEQATAIADISARVWCGKFIWRITNFEHLFNQARKGELPAIHSQPFYTGVPGYKMCLRVNLNGIDSGSGTHMSMFVHLMQGEYDSIVSWPFPDGLELTIMDQVEGDPHHVKEALYARPTLQAFLRPKTPRNHKGYGYVEMISHMTLRQRGYILNDTMIIKVDIRPSKQQ